MKPDLPQGGCWLLFLKNKLVAMRLREIQMILSENLPLVRFENTQIANFNPPQYSIYNVLEINKAINNLSQIGIFQSILHSLRATSLYNNLEDTIRVNTEENDTISRLINQLYATGSSLLEALDLVLHSQNLGNNNIGIKMNTVNNIDDIIEISEKLKKVIDLPLAEYQEGGEAKILNFDSGSFWIDIILPTSASVTLIGSIAWAGAVIFKKYQEAFAFKQYADGLEIQKEHLKVLSEAAKAKIDLDIEAEAKLIQNEFFNNGDNDQLGRLKHSIKEYSELIQKGVEIHPALTAPEKVENLFPNYSNLNLIESKQKYLPVPNPE